MRLYLAGPMRGYPAENHPAFHAGAARLRSAGHEVFSPAEHAESTGKQLRESLADDLSWICLQAEGIALLDGWQASAGAAAEVATAAALDIPCLELDGWL